MTGAVEVALCAVDVGASGGRVVAGRVRGGALDHEVVHRFDNGVVEREGSLYWDIGHIDDEIRTGLTKLAGRFGDVRSVGIDTWGVDYGLLDHSGRLVADPRSYRDPRTDPAIADVHEVLSHADLYAVNGLQFLPFNAIYQLRADRADGALDGVSRALLMPDLLGYLLTGVQGAELTNASTTGLLDVRSLAWSPALCAAADVPVELLADVRRPGEVVGELTDDVRAATGLSAGTAVTAVGSHDTASAVAAVPATEDDFAYISSGTWSLVGVELDAPLLSDASRAANFTNEVGVDDRIRYLRNVGGLWLLQECLRTWGLDAESDLPGLLDAAAALPSGGPLVDVDDDEFIPPGDMPARIREAVARGGARPPATRAEIVRCVLDSLARAYARTVERAAALAEKRISRVHVVGGGSRNAMLCQLTADACGLPVVAGPVEATAMGNLLVQARAHGLVVGTLEDIRRVVLAGSTTTTYQPRH